MDKGYFWMVERLNEDDASTWVALPSVYETRRIARSYKNSLRKFILGLGEPAIGLRVRKYVREDPRHVQ